MGEAYDYRINQSEHPIRFSKKQVTEVSPTWDGTDDPPSHAPQKLKPSLWTSIVAGGLAALGVDFALYPLDTFKTRLQSKQGFYNSGGFKSIYKGFLAVLITTAPISALFFTTYNTLVNTLRNENSHLNPIVYIAAASAAELTCSAFRVPVEVIKQRKQVSNAKSLSLIKSTVQKEGFLGLYRGFWSTLLREIPFAAIQFPLWEYLIKQFIIYENGKELTALQTAYCGAASGGVAAFITTPMDVIKTRIMLAEKENLDVFKKHFNYYMAKEVYRDRGLLGFFSGSLPRVLWITLGGFIYFGVYEEAKILCESNWDFFPSKIPPKHVKEQSPSYLEGEFEKCEFPKGGLCGKKGDDSVNEKEQIQETEGREKAEKETEHKRSKERQNIIDSTLLQPSGGSSRTK